MKKIIGSGLLVVMFLITGCFDIQEEITISEKGGGTYVTKMDMSAMMQMIQYMASPEEMQANGLGRTIDTVLKLQSIFDSLDNITAEQKKLYGSGILSLEMNMEKSVFKTEMNYPFSNYHDLQQLMNGSGTAGLSEAFREILKKGDTTQSPMQSQDEGISELTNIYDVTVSKNVFSRKLNKEKFEALMNKPEIIQSKSMLGSFDIQYTTTITLPRPVKKTDNPLLVLSPDKKTVTMKYDVSKLLETPEQFSYTIQY